MNSVREEMTEGKGITCSYYQQSQPAVRQRARKEYNGIAWKLGWNEGKGIRNRAQEL